MMNPSEQIVTEVFLEREIKERNDEQKALERRMNRR